MKILFLTNNPLSNSNSNGRTLLNMLENYNKDEIVNIFISGKCDESKRAIYYKINEKQLLSISKKCIITKYIENNIASDYKPRRKTAFKMFVRTIMWKHPSLFKQIKSIVNIESPQCIVLQCGDSPFLNRVAFKISKKKNLPLILYNSEDYIFKTWNYIEKKTKKGLFFRLFFRLLIKSYDNLYKIAKCAIYLTPDIEKLYQSRYKDHNSHFIYNSSNITKTNCYNENGDIVYSGNIGVGRIESLISISDIVSKIFNKPLVVYSLTSDKTLLDNIMSVKTIDFRGSLSYQDNIKMLKKAKLIIHCENFNDYYKKDTTHSFSTKIADSVSIGVPFLVYCPNTFSVYKYGMKNDCYFVSDNVIDLKNKFLLFKNDSKEITSKINNALICSKKNHSSKINSDKFTDIVNLVCR